MYTQLFSVMCKRIIYQLIMLIIAISTVSIFTLFSNPNLLQEKQQQQEHLQSAYAASLTSDLKQEIKQSMLQDNRCQRPDGCNTTSTIGQQITGSGNSAIGFNDQSVNRGQPAATATIAAPPPQPPQSPIAGNNATLSTGTLTVNNHVKCNFAFGCPTADKFSISVPTSNGSSISFNGSELGTSLRINPPLSVAYQVTENNPQYGFVTETLPLPAGSAPFGIAFNPSNGNMYMTNFNSDSVSVINPATNAVISTIPVGSAPFGIAFNPNNGNMYVTNAGNNTVSVINPSTNTFVATIPVGSAPFGIAFNPNNGNMYVTNAGGKTISVIAPLTTTYSGGCNGTIDAGQASAICNINSTYGK
jgi:YVTN family beta-propeller protein